jgi:hypothetical protein
MERSNQPPKTEDCLAEGQPVDLWFFRKEQPSRSVSTEKREPQAGPASGLSNSASKRSSASGKGVVMPETKIDPSAKGKDGESLPGSESVARAEGSTRNEGDPKSPWRTNYESQAGREAQREEAHPGNRESDWFIVASSKAQAPKLVKRPTDQRSPHRQPAP